MSVARSAKLGGELLACAPYKGRRTRFAIGRDDRVQNLSARDAAPAFEGQGPRVVPHVFKDILHHDTPAAWAVHRASPPERNQDGVNAKRGVEHEKHTAHAGQQKATEASHPASVE